MFKGITPFVRDTVYVMEGEQEVARLTAVWKRPDKKKRQQLALARLQDSMALQGMNQQLEQASALDDQASMSVLEGSLKKAAAVEEATKKRIRENLYALEGLADASGAALSYTPELLDQVMEWDEYLRPLSASLGRVVDFATVEQQEKNSLTLASTGPDFPPEVLVKQQPLPTMPPTTESAES